MQLSCHTPGCATSSSLRRGLRNPGSGPREPGREIGWPSRVPVRKHASGWIRVGAEFIRGRDPLALVAPNRGFTMYYISTYVV